jgi:purine-nucleoside phosphorylase
MILYEQIEEAVSYLRNRTGFAPRTGIVLGTGLGNLVDALEIEQEIAYGDIPHFAVSTVESHRGRLVFGRLDGHPLVVMAGRLHYYEGWTMQQVTFPVRVMKFLGIERLVLTNASGGVNPHLRGGDVVVVRDHINLLPEHPLRGPNDERLGPRFPDMSEPYDAAMRRYALDAAKAHGVRAIEGVYSALQGPNLETPAEYVLLRRLGADCTGMSSVPEALVARHMDVPVLMLSLVTNVSYPPSAIRETSVEDVIAVAKAAEPGLTAVLRGVLNAV